MTFAASIDFIEKPLRFEVLSAVSSGGMGRVDLARLLEGAGSEHGGEVMLAVKRPHPHMSDDEDFARMFMEEARLTWSIQHPNVARLIGWGRDDESIYMATEYVAGGPLHEVARRGRKAGDPMSAALIAFVIGRAAEGLAAAHGLTYPDGSPCNIVHRDISPSNIMVGFDGTVKIIDFGVAKIAQGGNGLRTATGVLKGKVPYMAPEYARGGTVDVTCDLYSLGVVLYELLCGHRPFSAEHDLELLRKVAEDPPPPLLAAVPALDPDLGAFVHQLLAKSKAERPASARSIVMVLDSFLLRQGHSHDEMRAELSAFVERHAKPASVATHSRLHANLQASSANAAFGSAADRAHGTRAGAVSTPLPSWDATEEPRGITRAVTPAQHSHSISSGPARPPVGEASLVGSAVLPAPHTRISSAADGQPSGLSGASVYPDSANIDSRTGRTPASTNSALFIPPSAPVKAPFYLWIAVATGLFSLVIALTALFLVSTRSAGPEASGAPPAAAGATAAAPLTSAVPVPVPAAEPVEPVSASATPTPPTPPAPVVPPTPTPTVAATGATTASKPPVAPGTATATTTKTATPVIRKPPAGSCTPMSFDYPRCLKH
jgi:eukaryotic-like serine/threonine-protein kinase